MRKRSTLTTLFLAVLFFAAAVTSLLASHHEIGPAVIYTSSGALQDAQGILEKAGYLAPGSYETGRRDGPTREAIRLFQEDHFIRVTGWLDHETMALLTSHGAGLSHSAPIAEQRGATEESAEVARADVEAPSEERTLTPDRLTKVEEIDAQIEPEPEPVNEAEEASAEPQAARKMPATASPTAMMAAAGSLLVALGIALLTRRRH